MHKPNSVDIARMMIRRHGLQAQAVAMERAAEMRQQGDISGLDHWESANAAIRELRRTAPSRHASRGEATA
jgi:hypothetical protein